MLTFYFNILIETKFLTIEQCIEMLTFDHIKYMRNITIPPKNMYYMTEINIITSAANQNQPVHIIIETSSFMSLLRAQLVANNHWFPYMNSEPGIPNR